ncbi:hypothetical protein KSZ_04390 [Dictyobacter formicarum]|uniref:Uncharacterized protein n=1 Tax=Dictyobacter formicarum TaxID=2778368 RepID=A0ABQ3V9T7_9CHLR|nr:hypothetical protein KSZ_04390 [Dictyobacter formicarum]
MSTIFDFATSIKSEQEPIYKSNDTVSRIRVIIAHTFDSVNGRIGKLQVKWGNLKNQDPLA